MPAMRRRLLAAAIVAVASLAEAAGFAVAGGASATDRDFARQAALGGLAEVTFARLAEQQAQDAAVVAYARWMVQDHGKANQQLAALVAQAGIEVPAAMDEANSLKFAQLRQLQGAAFDRSYMQSAIEVHRKAIPLLEAEIESGQAPQLRAFAASRLPKARHHLTTAWDIAGKMPGIKYLLLPSDDAAPNP
jgi:putative membrane protein